MAHSMDEVLQRPLYVYDLPPELLATLELSRENEVDRSQEGQVYPAEQLDLVDLGSQSNNLGSKSCSLCGLSFPTSEEQRSHIRSDFHGYNLKQKLRGLEPVSEIDFEKLVEDLEESLSGSDSVDSEEDEDTARKTTVLTTLLRKQAKVSDDGGEDMNLPQRRLARTSGTQPIIWFKSTILPSDTYLGIYRALFTRSELDDESRILEILRKKQLSSAIPFKTDPPSMPLGQGNPHIFLCMIGGGHFAAMVVSLTPRSTKSGGKVPLSREATVLAHKTFHRYTTRRKQGGAQSSNDSAKGPAHSVGSSLRRAMEVALMEEVRLLLTDWKGMIDSSQLLFIRATGNTNRKTLFGPYEGQVLKPDDPRLRTFPFSTRRATQNELMRSFIELTRMKIKQMTAEEKAAISVPAHERVTPRVTTKLPPSSTPSKRPEIDETALLHTTQIQAFIRRSKLPALLSYLKSNGITADFTFSPKETQQNRHTPTALHLAASLSNPTLVNGLLVKAGVSPEISNQEGKLPFDLAGDRATRDAFRVSRSQLGEGAWNWDLAHVPSALSSIEAEARSIQEKQEEEEKEADRRRSEAERLKKEGPQLPNQIVLGRGAERGRARALGAMQKTAQERRDEEARGLTPDMRASLERERRARAAEERLRRLQGGA